MRKFIALSLSLIMIASMTACGSSSNSQQQSEAVQISVNESIEKSSSVSKHETNVVSANATNFGKDTQAIIDRGVLRVGVKDNLNGFGYQNPLTGEYTGMEVDLARMIANYLGVELECVTVNAATRGIRIDEGEIDCAIATFMITDARRDSWDFTTPYYTDYVTALVENGSGIYSLEDMAGAVVGVARGSTSARSLVQACIDKGLINSNEFDSDTFDPAVWNNYISFKQYEDYPEISIALATGEVDAFCVDKSILHEYNTDGRHYINDEWAPETYGVATKLGSDFSGMCESLISGWLADGTINNLIAYYGLY